MIYVDVSSAVHGKAGLKRYAQSLVYALAPLLGERLRLFQNSLGRHGPLGGWAEIGIAQPPPTIGVRYGYKPWRGLVWLRHLLHWPLDYLLPEAALFHATEHLLPPLRDIPTVLTVHDLIYEHFPQHHKARNYLYLKATMPMYCRRASAIIAVSECTKADLLHLYNVPPSRVTVIPEAAAPHFKPQDAARVDAVRRRYGLPPRYLLTVGTIEPRKNLDRLVDACGPLFAADLVDALVLVGKPGWLYEGFFHHLDASPWRERVMLTGFVPDEDLPAVYAGAMLAVQPSLYEGFGFPVLEAMACGTPVCASKNSSLPEVGGEAAVYFDPENTEEMTAVLGMLLHDAERRHMMRQWGLEHAGRYSWEETARRTIALYEKVIREHKTC